MILKTGKETGKELNNQNRLEETINNTININKKLKTWVKNLTNLAATASIAASIILAPKKVVAQTTNQMSTEYQANGYAYDQKTGFGLDSLEIIITNATGDTLWKGTTDKQGHYETNNLTNLDREQKTMRETTSNPYPNPITDGELNINSYDLPEKIIKTELYNIRGQKINPKTELSPGIYFIRTKTTNKRTITSKIIHPLGGPIKINIKEQRNPSNISSLSKKSSTQNDELPVIFHLRKTGYNKLDSNMVLMPGINNIDFYMKPKSTLRITVLDFNERIPFDSTIVKIADEPFGNGKIISSNSDKISIPKEELIGNYLEVKGVSNNGKDSYTRVINIMKIPEDSLAEKIDTIYVVPTDSIKEKYNTDPKGFEQFFKQLAFPHIYPDIPDGPLYVWEGKYKYMTHGKIRSTELSDKILILKFNPITNDVFTDSEQDSIEKIVKTEFYNAFGDSNIVRIIKGTADTQEQFYEIKKRNDNGELYIEPKKGINIIVANKSIDGDGSFDVHNIGFINTTTNTVEKAVILLKPRPNHTFDDIRRSTLVQELWSTEGLAAGVPTNYNIKSVFLEGTTARTLQPIDKYYKEIVDFFAKEMGYHVVDTRF